MVLLIDNYDSFVFNLARYVQELGHKVRVERNDAVTLEAIDALNPEFIILSPGPKDPDSAGICLETVKRYAGVIPILGVCLGHQAIAQAFGGRVQRAEEPMHGKASMINHDQRGVFADIDQPLKATRYHSLIVGREQFPYETLDVTAWSDKGEIMGLQHKQWPVYGVQFHPESILTSNGYRLLEHFFAEAYHESMA